MIQVLHFKVYISQQIRKASLVGIAACICDFHLKFLVDEIRERSERIRRKDIGGAYRIACFEVEEYWEYAGSSLLANASRFAQCAVNETGYLRLHSGQSSSGCRHRPSHQLVQSGVRCERPDRPGGMENSADYR